MGQSEARAQEDQMDGLIFMGMLFVIVEIATWLIHRFFPEKPARKAGGTGKGGDR